MTKLPIEDVEEACLVVDYDPEEVTLSQAIVVAHTIAANIGGRVAEQVLVAQSELQQGLGLLDDAQCDSPPNSPKTLLMRQWKRAPLGFIEWARGADPDGAAKQSEALVARVAEVSFCAKECWALWREKHLALTASELMYSGLLTESRQINILSTKIAAVEALMKELWDERQQQTEMSTVANRLDAQAVPETNCPVADGAAAAEVDVVATMAATQAEIWNEMVDEKVAAADFVDAGLATAAACSDAAAEAASPPKRINHCFPKAPAVARAKRRPAVDACTSVSHAAPLALAGVTAQTALTSRNCPDEAAALRGAAPAATSVTEDCCGYADDVPTAAVGSICDAAAMPKATVAAELGASGLPIDVGTAGVGEEAVVCQQACVASLDASAPDIVSVQTPTAPQAAACAVTRGARHRALAYCYGAIEAQAKEAIAAFAERARNYPCGSVSPVTHCFRIARSKKEIETVMRDFEARINQELQEDMAQAMEIAVAPSLRTLAESLARRLEFWEREVEEKWSAWTKQSGLFHEACQGAAEVWSRLYAGTHELLDWLNRGALSSFREPPPIVHLMPLLDVEAVQAYQQREELHNVLVEVSAMVALLGAWTEHHNLRGDGQVLCEAKELLQSSIEALELHFGEKLGGVDAVRESLASNPTWCLVVPSKWSGEAMTQKFVRQRSAADPASTNRVGGVRRGYPFGFAARVAAANSSTSVELPAPHDVQIGDRQEDEEEGELPLSWWCPSTWPRRRRGAQPQQKARGSCFASPPASDLHKY